MLLHYGRYRREQNGANFVTIFWTGGMQNGKKRVGERWKRKKVLWRWHWRNNEQKWSGENRRRKAKLPFFCVSIAVSALSCVLTEKSLIVCVSFFSPSLFCRGLICGPFGLGNRKREKGFSFHRIVGKKRKNDDGPKKKRRKISRRMIIPQLKEAKLSTNIESILRAWRSNLFVLRNKYGFSQ